MQPVSGLGLLEIYEGLVADPPLELKYGARLEGLCYIPRGRFCEAKTSGENCHTGFYVHLCTACEDRRSLILVPVCLCGYVDAELTPCERFLYQEHYGRLIRTALCQEVSKRSSCLDKL